MYKARATTRAALSAAVLLLTGTGCHQRAVSSGNLDLDAVPTVSVREDLRLGSRDDPDVGFTRPMGVDVDRDGNTYVAEGSTMKIRVYGPDGSLLRRFGGRGEGPGEFQTMRFGVVGDTVWATDVMARRITLFDRQGKLLSARRIAEVSVSLPPGKGYVLPSRMRPDGRFTSNLSLVMFNRGAEVQGSTDSIRVPRVLFDADGSVVDTIGWDAKPPPRMWRRPEESSSRPELVTVGSRRYMAPSPPPDLPQWLPLDDGELIVYAPAPSGGEEGTVTVTRMSLKWDTVYSRRLTFQPIPYTSVELDSIAAQSARRGGGAFLSAAGISQSVPDNVDALAAAYRKAMKFPDFHAGITYGWLDQDGRLWLHTDEGIGRSTDRWVILGAKGRLLEAVELPSGTRVVWSRGDAFWTIQTDDMDVPWLVWYTMEEAP